MDYELILTVSCEGATPSTSSDTALTAGREYR